MNCFNLKTQEYIEKLKEKCKSSIFPIEEYKGHATKILHKCELCGYDKYLVSPSVLLNRNKFENCPYCYNKSTKLIIGKNDLWTTYPEIAKLLLNPEDGYKCSSGSAKKLEFRCPECGNIIISDPRHIKRRHLHCPKCSDGVSIPEKFMMNFLEMNNIKYIYNKKMDWSDNKRYDFITNDTIIETHGLQHYNVHPESVFGTTLEEQEKIDQYKKELALNNGIKHYIELDCRESSLEYIKNSILNSDILKILNIDFNDFDWKECYKNSLKSITIEACELYNKYKNTAYIARTLKINKVTVKYYLLKGEELGIIKYEKRIVKNDFSTNKNKKGIKVISVTDKIIFDSMNKASKYYGITSDKVYDVCNGIYKYVKYIDNQKLIFRKLEEYDENFDYLKDVEEKDFQIEKERIQKMVRKVRCLTTNEIFDSIKEASKKYNIPAPNITLHCQGKHSYAGKVNGKKMVWEYI